LPAIISSFHYSHPIPSPFHSLSSSPRLASRSLPEIKCLLMAWPSSPQPISHPSQPSSQQQEWIGWSGPIMATLLLLIIYRDSLFLSLSHPTRSPISFLSNYTIKQIKIRVQTVSKVQPCNAWRYSNNLIGKVAGL